MIEDSDSYLPRLEARSKTLITALPEAERDEPSVKFRALEPYTNTINTLLFLKCSNNDKSLCL